MEGKKNIGKSDDQDRINEYGDANLNYDEEQNSFELDLAPDKSTDKDYQHLDPYETTAPNGDDFNSDYDEANPFIGDEYDKNASLETNVDALGMHISDDEDLTLTEEDIEDAKTPEDYRDDLDEEGYPKNDRKR
ncbi:hypothetical protein Pedsa_2296 [Pseudopedobacter saltans DSM 12145]|uniref:Uncharacterized protein n=1 Tax=Pseudopedobacter saltans (strain ATCC 51119 / DSM 12145 / JCM 21818 / CCUG 39354 / LMG 10337 / NBRC 100064 / NCIMB 13643) TaxID=762903 RepID=F0SD59_PSESL|nr:hypothetical protein [Pseudopedobacter saltans]ADY52845.1 hypothetical protein Pedsa_2296 [Pseudopedobacter saltans DSM 12145]